ncbi:ion transport protein [Plasmodium cynomolgi strain B]|uniref:Ion transport protein n=1 Tax=Plasmodium cynomolgi (strain B) TaxID=1120755 RepID=K6UEX3_PLACD|nr:ion transport protein [Plasmodium cynomolgi strain B]GAB69101.1 ion transport protein [Plasmodium cynomolgi strain B]
MINGGVKIKKINEISSSSCGSMSFGGSVHTANTAKVGTQSSSEVERENKIATHTKGTEDSTNYNEMVPLNSMDDELDLAHSPSYRNYYHMLERVSLNMYYYLEGLKYNIYRFQFPECMRGFLFQTATEYLYQKYSAFLIGIITINKEIFLNPVDYIIGEENKFYYTSAFSGIILTTSLDNLIKLSSIKNISKKVYEYNDRRISERFRGKKAPGVRAKGGEPKVVGMNAAGMNAAGVKAARVKAAGVNAARGKVNFDPSGGNSGSDGQEQGEADRSSQPREEKITCRSNLLYNFFLGIYEIDNYISAYRDIFSEKDKPLLLVCGWPDNVHMFLKHLQVNTGNWLRHRRKKKRRREKGGKKQESGTEKGGKRQTGGTENEQRGEQPIVHVDNPPSDTSCADDSCSDSPLRKKKRAGGKIKYNIIILSLHVPKFNYENDLLDFSHNVAFIRGSALNSTNLIQAGVFYAKRLIIFNANHSLFIDKDAYRIDNEVIIIKNVIHQLYNSVLKSRFNYMNLMKRVFKKEFKDVNINEKVFASEAPYQLNEMIRCKTLNIFNINRNPYLICMIKNSESLEYIDGSINLSYENYNDNEKMNKIWENCGEYIYTFELVSANIFVDEMLHNLVSFSLPISKYAIEYSVIYSLIGIDINEYSKNAKAFHKNLKLCTGQVNLIPIPSYFYKKSFYKCFSYFLHNKQCLCIGILRYMDISPLCKKSHKLFVLSCPSRTMKIERDDQAYVISYNMK